MEALYSHKKISLRWQSLVILFPRKKELGGKMKRESVSTEIVPHSQYSLSGVGVELGEE